MLDPTASVSQFADDPQVATKTNLFAVVAHSTTLHWAPAGLSFKPTKDACWLLDGSPFADPHWQAKRVDRLRCSGSDLLTSP